MQPRDAVNRRIPVFSVFWNRTAYTHGNIKQRTQDVAGPLDAVGREPCGRAEVVLLRSALALQVCRCDVVLGPEPKHCMVSMHASDVIDQKGTLLLPFRCAAIKH